MKISDENFIEALWRRQVHNAAKGVIDNYIGGTKGVCSEGESWLQYAVDVHTAERQHITDKIGKQQILKRIRDLIDRGHVMWCVKDCTFMLRAPERNQALFDDARQSWLDLGVPTGIDNGVCRSVKVEDFDAKVEQVREKLFAKHLPYFKAT